MSGLRIRHLFIDVTTALGKYGVRIPFGNGLNVIRADNSMGKSTCLRAIVYCLGLEGMFSPSQDVPLAHVVTDYVEEGETRADVIESNVYLEIENDKGDFLTIQRAVKGTKNRHLVSVHEGRAISEKANLALQRDYYVREPFAATSERGFHARLAEFVGWALPMVPRFNDVECPLYLETIFPLLFVEQKRNWGAIPGRYPTWLGIRDVARRSVEFLMGLDAYKVAVERRFIADEMQRLEARWSTLLKEGSKMATAVAGMVKGIPSTPTAEWPPEISPQLLLLSESVWIPAPTLRLKLAEHAADLATREVPKSGEIGKAAAAELDVAEERLAAREAETTALLEFIEKEASQIEAMQSRLYEIDDDLRKHRDIRKLQRLGSVQELEHSTGFCPTCHQLLADTLLQTQAEPMSVEQNISFLEEQEQVFEAVLTTSRSALETREAELNAKRAEIDDLRARVRSLRDTLTDAEGSPSIEAVAQRLRLEQRLGALDVAISNFDDLLSDFAELADDWRAVQARKLRLPKGALSALDERKLSAMENSFKLQLGRYQMESLPPEDLSLSRADYEPTLEGLNLPADVSASDLIRMHWAYLLGLIEVSGAFDTNHLGCLFMDEPQQQGVSEGSFEELIKFAASFPKAQIVIATSHDRGGLTKALRGVGPHSLVDFPGRIIQRM